MQEVQDNRFGEPVEAEPGFSGQQDTGSFEAQPQNFGTFGSNTGSSETTVSQSQGAISTQVSQESTGYIDNTQGYNVQAPAQQADLYDIRNMLNRGSQEINGQNRFTGVQESQAPLSPAPQGIPASQTSQNRFTTSQENFGGSQSTFTSSQTSQESFQGQPEIYQGQSQSINLGGSSTSRKSVRPVIQVGEPIIKKSFYIHAAPEDDEPTQVEQKVQTIRPEKHYKIIFIKAPNVAPAQSSAQIPAIPRVSYVKGRSIT
jgi:hypothetical protein